MILNVQTASGPYPVYLERGALFSLGEKANLARRALVVRDDGVPVAYAKAVAASCKDPVIVTLPQGEGTKNLESFGSLLTVMAQKGFTRTDCVIAVGGGVVGDLAGFVAASYMRGVDFYNVPTTLLSQVDSSIGGKVAVDLLGYKNLVGAFYPPKAVFIDPDTLKTLDERQFACGMAEAVKTALIRDAALFDLIEQNTPAEVIDRIIEGSLMVKKAVVEADEKEGGERKLLNFGHTLAHAIESESAFGLLHGECVALGMIPFCSPSVRARLIPLLEKLGLPTSLDWDPEAILSAMRRDKKKQGDTITVVRVDEIGKGKLVHLPFMELESVVRGIRV
ncbi:MAG: 3-dehydroquinate synthase [Clostridia bacterium]|nr:3-dehydroquinate synthase [Clostridia bacterium]